MIKKIKIYNCEDHNGTIFIYVWSSNINFLNITSKLQHKYIQLEEHCTPFITCRSAYGYKHYIPPHNVTSLSVTKDPELPTNINI